MRLFISHIFSVEIQQKSNIPLLISNNLSKYFKEKEYGSGLFELGINLICVSSNFEQFFKPKKPKFINEKKTKKSVYTKQEYEIEKYLTFDLKLDYETFKNASEEESKKIIAQEIVSSFSTLDNMKKKIKDFDWEQFEKDVKQYFNDQGLL